jgi:hypothetical protein
VIAVAEDEAFAESVRIFTSQLGEWSIALNSQVAAMNKAPRLAYSDGMLEIRGNPGGTLFVITFADSATFELDLSSKQIRIDPGGSSARTISHFLLDQVLPRLLAHNDELVLHAAGVRIGDELALVVGRSGIGKSTLAASLLGAGHELLGDDAMILANDDQGFGARTVYPSLRLFADSASATLDRATELESVGAYTLKQSVKQSPGKTHAISQPVGAIFLLQEEAEEISCERVGGSVACAELLRQTFALDPGNPTKAGTRLAKASAIARTVPMFDLAYPRQYSALPRVHEAVLGAMCQLERGSQP